MINIAIDGFMGSGKSTLAKGLSKKLNYKVLDTGAIFRAIACAYDKKGQDDVDEDLLKSIIDKIDVKVVFIGEEQHVFVDDEDYTSELRSEKISTLASKISAKYFVREKYLSIAREFAKNNDCIMEGRDIGTVVMPNADVKFFLTAGEAQRAKRRFDELVNKGVAVEFDNVLKDLKERDYRDSHRDIAPLKPAEDAITIDNADMTLDETVDYCYDIIVNKINK